MKKLKKYKPKPCLVFIFTLLLFFIGCWKFLSIDQPDLADPNSSIEIPITISHTDSGGYGRGYFGIQLPIGWTVEDSVSYQGILNGKFIYSSEYSDSMEHYNSAPDGYYWWVGVGDSIHGLPEGSITFTPQITTDEQTGTFFIDYMISNRIDRDYIFGGPYPISINAPLTMTVTNTNDNGPGSLRQAISDVSSSGEILFDLSYPATIVLDSQLVIDRNLKITGPESGQLIISGNNKSRVISIMNLKNVTLSNLTITDGLTDQYNDGGGISCDHSGLNLKNVTITNNRAYYGGGISCSESNLSFSNVTITGNTASRRGGGISIKDSSTVVFDSTLRSNIYNNIASQGNDLYSNHNKMINVVLDTFTVLYPTGYYAYPFGNFNFDILNAKIIQYDRDLYVKPDGDNNRNGTSWSEAFKNISFAISRIRADSLHPHTIFISDGIYSPSTGENFPLRVPDYVTLSGNSREKVILDGEEQSSVFRIGLGESTLNRKKKMIENITITRGIDSGFYCSRSTLTINNVNIRNNQDGGILAWDSRLILKNVNIRDNIGGGISVQGSGSDINLKNVTITGNKSYAAIWIEGSNNRAALTNVTIYGNTNRYVGAIGAFGNNITISLINCILWENSPQEIYFEDFEESNTLITAHSNIKNGRKGIVIVYNNNFNDFWLDGNINTYPLFMDIEKENFRLQAESPCIDKGIQDTVIIYNEGLDTLIVPPMSFIGSAPDMGAYEFDPDNPLNLLEQCVSKPDRFTLYQNYPNPFNPKTVIRYALPVTSHLELSIYNILGQKVATLVNKKQPAGNYQVEWDASGFSSGVYLYRLSARNPSAGSGQSFVETKKLVFLK